MAVEILADSLNVATGDRLTTFLIDLWKPVLGELARHRMLSINAESSRAIPVSKVKEQVINNPFIPQFTLNQKGMQGAVINDSDLLGDCLDSWLEGRDRALESVAKLEALKVHKQHTNRILEPWVAVSVMVTATEWDNFFKLRCDEATQPELRAVALQMRDLKSQSCPRELKPGEWHLPYYSGIDLSDSVDVTDILAMIVAKSARISYGNHLKDLDLDKAKALHDELKDSGHWSCFEHAAVATSDSRFSRNFKGFMHYRAMLENHNLL